MKIIGTIGFVLGVVSCIVWSIIFLSNVVIVVPLIFRAAENASLQINKSALVPFLVSPFGIIRSGLLIVASRMLSAGKENAPRWALAYGIVAILTGPLSVFMLYREDFMAADSAGFAIAYAAIPLLLGAIFLRFGLTHQTPKSATET